ncbi:putative ATPase SCDLUD_000388 [Saccharomycodes ludwigii]|uniref:putative ATPase n=1 Tax=Saccharomycodes ludwigii TaxID=36035 RepID=UPI001E89C083|nr:hypothetical protein SCDLUD_000388 [Saccharomycodes ludwigii]KAH3902797.1 hypothetical protein SCDLUD_000388 [Saccharomycodes ludwigii]
MTMPITRQLRSRSSKINYKEKEEHELGPKDLKNQKQQENDEESNTREESDLNSDAIINSIHFGATDTMDENADNHIAFINNNAITRNNTKNIILKDKNECEREDVERENESDHDDVDQQEDKLIDDLISLKNKEFKERESKYKKINDDKAKDNENTKSKNINREHNTAKDELGSKDLELKLDQLNEFIRQSKVYSQIIADTLLKQNIEDNTVTDTAENTKRKASAEPSKKKRKTIMEFFRQKDENVQQEQDDDQNASAYADKYDIQQPSMIKNCTLKPYQVSGLNWLTTLYSNGLNGILADEMGLGKTLQTISLLAFIYENDTPGPYLIVAPLSTIDNWMNELQKFAPDLPALKYYGAKSQRDKYTVNRLNSTEGCVVTTYEIIIRDIAKLNAVDWKFLIVDEGHRLKNINCRLIKELKTLRTNNRLLLTGTPLQNNLSELWTLLNFILPDIFSDYESFSKWFDYDDLANTTSDKLNDIISAELQKNLVTNLHTILKPFLLRRLKKNVLNKTLPPKREYIINCPLTPWQEFLYRSTLNSDLRAMTLFYAIDLFFSCNSSKFGKLPNRTIEEYINWKSSGSDIMSTTETFKQMDILYDRFIDKQIRYKKYSNTMMQLRQIVDSTLLIYSPFQLEDVTPQLDTIVKSSGKLKVLDELLTKLMACNHKVLIFSQFVGMLDIIEDYLFLKKIKHCRIDGSMDNDERREQIERFQRNAGTSVRDKSDMDVFLISTRSGGLGINLTHADSVILFDSDWNPQVDLQAMDRVHRIGQTRPVVVYRFFCDRTIENVILSRAMDKRYLEKIVIEMGDFQVLKDLSVSGNLTGTTTKNISRTNLLKNELHKLLNQRDSIIGFTKSDLTRTNSTSEYAANNRNANWLTNKELKVLEDRSLKAYDGNNIKACPHIKLFETSNNEFF